MGWLGQLHPTLAATEKIKSQVFIAELQLDRLHNLPLQKPSVREISRFQPVRRDFSLVVPHELKWAAIDSSLGELAGSIPELIDWRVREVLRDGARESNRPGAGAAQEYSLLLGMTFQAADRTLRDEELQTFSDRVIQAVSSTGARLRA